jgi:hypothetical protein
MRKLKPEAYKKLKRINHLLLEALATMTELQKSAEYIGGVDHLKRLLKAKIVIETLLEKTMMEEVIKQEPKEPSRESLDRILLALLGKEYLVRAWWNSPNRAFENRTPEHEFLVNKKAVIKYLLSQLNGDYS